MDWLDQIKWDRDGLVPVIAQEQGTGDVLMFAWMNREALARTAELRRELHEEIGITIGAAHPWKVELMDYPHARVRLHFCKVFDWTGEFEMRERQAMAWQTLPVEVTPVLPGTIPVLRWFAQERGFTGVTHREP